MDTKQHRTSRAADALTSRWTVAAGCLAASVLTPAGGTSAGPRTGLTQSDASFAASYAAAGVRNVSSTTKRVSCYAPEVVYVTALTAGDGYPGGGITPCPGATTGEQTSDFDTQDVFNRRCS